LKKQHARNLISLNNVNQGVGSIFPSLYMVEKQNRPLGSEKARAYAFLLLKFRLRSEAELKTRLEQKGFSAQLAESTVSFLKDKEFIDDRVFAKGWVSGRLKRPFGLRKIKQELAQKGVAKEIIQDALAQVNEHYSESQIVSQLAQQRFSRLKGIDPLKARARVYGYLMRRGFSPDVVSEIVSKL
jgi:regulatory protein